MKDILIALIHNKQEERLENARAVVKVLAGTLSETCMVNTIEESDQPPVKPVSVYGLIYRDIQFRNLFRKWEKYRQLKPSAFFNHWVLWLLGTLQKYLFNQTFAKKRRTQLAIDAYITAKHIRAWEIFADSGSDFLIVFEDDILLSKDYLHGINPLLAKTVFEGMAGNTCLYVDVAGGVSFNQLNVQNLVTNYQNGIRYFSKPVTNTACGYVLNASLAGHFLRYLDKQPSLKYLTVDFLMNYIFIKLGQDGINCRCMHFDPPLFEHGSFKGAYKQWR